LFFDHIITIQYNVPKTEPRNKPILTKTMKLTKAWKIKPQSIQKRDRKQKT